ncbi:hypothetical protein CR513_62242, partial [Mucuna pruriens]
MDHRPKPSKLRNLVKKPLKKKHLIRTSFPSSQERFTPCGKTKKDPNGRTTLEGTPKKDKSHVVCYEYKKPKHFKFECPSSAKEKKNKKKPFFKKKKGLIATWEDFDLSSSKEEGEEANICLMVDIPSKGEEEDDERKHAVDFPLDSRPLDSFRRHPRERLPGTGDSSRDPLDVSTQEAQPSSVVTPAGGASSSGSGSSSSSESRDNYPFRIVYRDHRSNNLAEGPYSWVDPEVLRVSSLLTRSSSLLGMASAICQPRTWSVSVSACWQGESVCMSSAEGTKPFFYLYDTLHPKLGIKLPFTHFERAVLQALNVAPTQLHPNSWAFIRAFELLCEELGKAPTLGVFFWFFTPCKTDRVGWTSLRNKAKRKLWRPFLESYKTFKARFFRVAPSDPNSRLLTDRSGRSYFPLQWTRQPAVSIAINTKKLESWKCSFIAELREMPVLRNADIIKGEGYSTKALANLRKRKEQAPSQASPPVDVEAEVAPLSAAGQVDLPQASNASPSSHRTDRGSGGRPNKRLHLGEEVQGDDASASLDVLAPHPSDRRSLLYKSFVRVADRTLASSSLELDVERLGLAGVCGALQQYAAHGFALARVVEKKFGDLEVERSSWAEQRKSSEEENRKLSSALLEAEARLNDYQLSTTKLQGTLQVAQKMNGELLNTKAKLLQAKSNLELGNDSLQAEVKRLREDAAEVEVAHQDELKSMGESLKAAQDTIEACDKTIYQQGIDIMDQYEVGFRRAIRKVKFLHPSIDISEADPFKEIVDGQLMASIRLTQDKAMANFVAIFGLIRIDSMALLGFFEVSPWSTLLPSLDSSKSIPWPTV